MKITLINPPNCGRSIPEEEYGITTLKMIFRGEPLALEMLAGNLGGHEVNIIDLKADPESFEGLFQSADLPHIVGFTGVTCEANTVIRLAREIKSRLKKESPVIIVGGHHASSDPGFFNCTGIDYIVVGLGKLSFKKCVDRLVAGDDPVGIPGVIATNPGRPLVFTARKCTQSDLVDGREPRYDLVKKHRDKYVMSGVGGKVGFVATAFGCTHNCSFCSIPSITGGRYLTHSIDAIVRDIQLLHDISLIRFVDANTFGDLTMAKALAQKLISCGIEKKIVADVRADTVVRDPGLMRLWQQAGLVAVVIGFEEIDDRRLIQMNKRSTLSKNVEALQILAEIGIRVVGDFIIAPDYDYADFERLEKFIENAPISLPIPSILTPLPGTALYRQCETDLEITDLDYYTFSNAVLPTRLPKEEFYSLYSGLMKHLHTHISEK